MKPFQEKCRFALEGKNLPQKQQIFPLRVNFNKSGKIEYGRIAFPESVCIPLNPIALRRSKLYGVLAVLSAIGLRYNMTYTTLRSACTSAAGSEALCYLQYINDGWMICNFTSFSTVLQSYQTDRWLIMKGCVQWKPVHD